MIIFTEWLEREYNLIIEDFYELDEATQKRLEYEYRKDCEK